MAEPETAPTVGQRERALTASRRELQTPISRWERFARRARGWGLGWTIWTALTYISLSIWPTAAYAEGRLIFIAGAVLSTFFAVGLSWRTQGNIRGSLPRIMMLLRWQVATGLTLAFSFAIAARDELRLPILLYGGYLIISVIPLMAVSLIDGKLRGLHDEARELDHATEFARVFELLAALKETPTPRAGRRLTSWKSLRSMFKRD